MARPEQTGRNESGEWRRSGTRFRDWVSADGSTELPAVSGRYHLYVSMACPWAHRAIIVRRLMGLEDAISISNVDPIRDERGWAFRAENGGEPDPVNGFDFLSEAYTATDPAYDGRLNVPVLWDRECGRIVNHESADIIVMLATAFGDLSDADADLYPQDLRHDIDKLNERVYEVVNNGVYRSGFATSQRAYEGAVRPLFEELDALEERLADSRYLFGDRQTLADWRLFTTLIRFDPVYYVHFKCNVRRIVDYSSLWGYTRDLLSTPGIRETVDIDQIKLHYYGTHPHLNPSGIVPVGPAIDYEEPHQRDALAG